ncbi:MAG TPA: hypothetical protein VF699_10450 [Caulobacteraceae bacterium]|jgi:hypothetical protein
MTTRRTSPARPVLERLLDRLAAVIAISLVAVSGGLLMELNQQAQAEARVTPFEQSDRALG